MPIEKAFIHDAIPLHNFEFQKKKKCSIVNKRLSPKVFRVVSFSRKCELCKKWNLKAIQSNLKYGLIEVKKVSLQMFDLVLNMPL